MYIVGLYKSIPADNEKARKHFVEVIGRFMGVFVSLGVKLEDICEDLKIDK